MQLIHFKNKIKITWKWPLDIKKLTLIKNSIETFCANHPIKLALILSFVLSVFVVPLSIYLRLYNKDFFINILVEIHGLIFDLLIIGSILLFFTKLGEKRQEIRRYREEIIDYLGWKSDEAKYRIIGNIKRLNRLGVTNIFLEYAYLVGVELHDINLKNASLYGADLSWSLLQRVNLQDAVLIDANLRGTIFMDVAMQGTEFGAAHMEEAILDGAHLEGAHLDGADLHKAILSGAHLEGAHLEEAELLEATLESASLQGADLSDILYDDRTFWRGATYDDRTIWPDEFIISGKGMKKKYR